MEYFLTGSRVYGGYNLNSDIDIVMSEIDARKIEDTLKMMGIPRERKFNPKYPGFYFKFLGFEFNIIVLGSGDVIDYNAWEYATKQMCKLPVFESKAERKEKFREFCKEFKLLKGIDGE